MMSTLFLTVKYDLPQGFPPGAYFLTDEKVGKESPRNFRMFLGLFRRLKGAAERKVH